MKSIFGSIFGNFKRLFIFAWREDKFLVLGLYGFAILGAFFPIIASYIYKLTIDGIIDSQEINPTVPMAVVALLGGIYITNFAWDFVMWGLKEIYFEHLFRYKIQNALGVTFFTKVSHLDVAHHEDAQTQNLILKAEDTFTWRVPDFFREFGNLFNNVVSLLTALIVLIPFGIIIPFTILLATLPKLILRAKYGKIEWSIYGMAAPEVRRLWYLRWLLTNRTASSETRVLQSQPVLLGLFKNIQDKLYEERKKPVRDYLKVAYYPQILQMAIIFLFAYLALPDVLTGAMSVGTFTFFISLLDRISNSAGAAVSNFGDLYENNLYVQHYFEVLDIKPFIREDKNPVSLKVGKRPPKIEFKNVSFSYPGSRELVIKDISFKIEPGENIAVVGPNGAGKSTIVKLLCRFYDVTSGEILINGINIKKLRLDEWYEFLGTLFQDFVQYELTVKDNIMVGNYKVDNKRLMIEAARKSGAAEFIENLPEKYDQLLGKEYGGVELSKGQWQKLAIARAFYEGAPILILDEPTSAIDAEAEYEIFSNLEKFYKDKTLFLVSHRFSTVRNADKIIVLRNGQIAEVGTHKELVLNKGLYARMFRKQASGYID